MKLRLIGRRDRTQGILRLIRLTWNIGAVGYGGYSSKLTLALAPRLFGWKRERCDWFLFVAGLRIHYARSYGGGFV